MMILSNPLLLFLLLVSNTIRLPRLERGDEGGHGSTWVSISLGLPLNLRDLEHLTIETRLITESIECVIGECVSTFIINR